MKILLITDIPPCRNYTAGLVLDMLCRFLPRGSVVCCGVMNPEIMNAVIEPDLLEHMPFKRLDKPRESWPAPAGLFAAAGTYFAERRNAGFVRTTLAEQIAEYGAQFSIDKIWFVVQGQTEIRLVRPVSRMLNKPYVVQIWDPLYLWLDGHNVDPVTQASLMVEFGLGLRDSDGFFAASWNMAREYGTKYKVRSVPFISSLDPRLERAPALSPSSGNELVIGGNGKVYPIEMWTSLCRALDSVRWRIAGRRTRIRIMTNATSLLDQWKDHVEITGWLSQGETVSRLSECDIMYCPYWLDPYFAEVSRLSFPGKLAAFLAAGRPVLFHGPDFASPASFLRDNNAGVVCSSYESESIVGKLEQLATDTALYATLAANASIAFRRYLTSASLRTNFAELLRIDERELTT